MPARERSPPAITPQSTLHLRRGRLDIRWATRGRNRQTNSAV